MTRTRTMSLAALAALAALVARDASAVTTKSWNTASYKEFDEGEGSEVLISSLGEVMPGTVTRRVDVGSDSIWTAVRAPDGTIYGGGVTDGTVWAVSGDKARKLAELEQDTPWIGSLALGADGTLYAGTVTSGTIWAIDMRSGKAQKVVKLDGAEHVWAMVVDGKTLWAGTGTDGALYSVDLAAKSAKKVWSSGENHLLSIARARDGALWIGTADEAILYRFDPRTNQARAIADFAGSELRAVVEVDGVFVVAANEFDASRPAGGGAPKGSTSRGTPAKPPEPGSAPGAQGSGAPESAPPRPGERKGKGGLFRVEPDGRVEQLHALAEAYFTSLAVGNGEVWAAAGAQGRVYRVRSDRVVLTAFDVEERQVNAIMALPDGGVAFATGDGAAVYVSAGAAQDGKYTSKVFDAQFPCRWGNLRWRGDASLVVETRSGNTSKPDRGWSAWQKVANPAKGGGETVVGRVQSPPGRYLQYRVTFAGGAGVLKQVTVYYVPQNQRARVNEITVADETNKAPVTLAAGAAKPRSPILKVRWKVENPDGDELTYKVEMRPEGDAEWRPVPTGQEPLTKAEFDWNTESLPDGHYRLRVTASDGNANPREQALEHSLISQPFLIDNGKPQVLDLQIKHPFVSGRALDTFSRIDEIAWSIDGGEWQMAYPRDGIFDDVSELFTIKLPDDLKLGTHTLSVRVADEADNIGAATMTFRVTR